MKTLVIGLGNPILKDDGVGIYAARALRRLVPPDRSIDVEELAVGGLRLMESMIDYDRVIVIDAVWSPDGEVGQVVQFDAGDLPSTMNSASAHDVDLPTALQVGRRLGASLPADDAIQIVGITAREVLAFDDKPSTPVMDAIPRAVNCVLELLGGPALADDRVLEYSFSGGYDGFS